MSSTISPNMGLIVPTVANEPGPTWAEDINSDWSIIDQHNHSPGQGVQINPNGMFINADLPFNNNNGTLFRSVRFQPQSATLSGVNDLGCLYEVTADLWYNDGAGNQVRITQGGAVTGASGTITGLPSGTASAAYLSVSQTFQFQSATNTPANIDGASFILRNLVANSKGLTLSPPPAMSANYTLTLPNVPAVTSLVTLDSSGTFGTTPFKVPTVQTFLTGSGTYTTPSNPAPLYIIVTMVGGGGKGGPGNTSQAGGGGGAGSYIKSTIVSPSASYSYAVGVGGVAGSPGGDTTFGANTAGGGNVGGTSNGGGGGTATLALGVGIAINGGGGGGGQSAAGQATGGSGGNGAYGGGGLGVNSIGGNGVAGAVNSGAGGSGGAGTGAGVSTGGFGADGSIVVEEFYQ